MEREATGRGVHIDFSQIEGGVHFLSPAIVAFDVNGENLSRLGNADPYLVPHGVYPAGVPDEDRWVALACRDDADWVALCDWMGRPSTSSDTATSCGVAPRLAIPAVTVTRSWLAKDWREKVLQP